MEGLTSFIGNKCVNFCGKKSTVKLSGCLFFEKRRENLKLNVILVLESKALFLEEKVPFPEYTFY